MTISDIQNSFLEFNLFTKEECRDILEKKISVSPTNYTVKLDGKFYEKGCSLKSQDLEDTDENSWIFEKVKNYLSSILDIEWVTNPHAVFREYIKGDFFLEHKDNVDSTGSDPRYFTVTVQLSGPEEYSGGTVIVRRDTELSKEIGSATIWGSNVVHEVKNIEEGIRNSLIFFISSRHINIKKSSLI